mmetsp:Transcript_18201/g.27412  ORF Transcript_18201/g.27412 Transcript_18201/m.27412 type:complete len:88 (-) Transcript_18201:609-872(-)
MCNASGMFRVYYLPFVMCSIASSPLISRYGSICFADTLCFNSHTCSSLLLSAATPSAECEKAAMDLQPYIMKVINDDPDKTKHIERY